MALQNDLGKDNVRRLVIRLAIPSMMAQFVNVLYSIVDRMYIGNIEGIGEIALAGVGVCGPIVTLITSFASLVGIGGAPLLAIRLGEKNIQGAKKILANCFVLLLVLSGILTALFLTLKGPMLWWFGASAKTFGYANEYLTIYCMGTVFAILATGLNQFIICQGFATLGMCTVLLGAVMNIVLDPIFIFVFHMGVSGAAIATVLSQMGSCGFVLLVLFSKRVPVRISFSGYSLRIMKRVVTFGLSPFIIIATDSILLIVLNSVLMRWGGAKGDMLIACFTIVQSYMQLITLPMGGITGGTQPILSYNYGAKNIERIKSGERNIVALCLLFAGTMWLLSQFVPGAFASIFTQNPEYIQMSVWGIRVFTMGVVVLALQYAFVDGLTALGIARVAITLSLSRKAVFLLLVLFLPPIWGATSAFYAEPIADILCGIVTTVTFTKLIGHILDHRLQMPDGQSLYS